MTNRSKAVVAAVALLALSTGSNLNAQPLAPSRPPNSAFGSYFTPGSYAYPNAGGFYGGGAGVGAFGGAAFGAGPFGAGPFGAGPFGAGPFGAGPFGANNALVPGFGTQRNYGPFAPYVLSMQPAVFNSRGHWYSQYYGHWYPNGIANGTGALSNGGRGGSSGSGLALLSGMQGAGTIGGSGGSGPQAPAAGLPGILGNPPNGVKQ